MNVKKFLTLHISKGMIFNTMDLMKKVTIYGSPFYIKGIRHYLYL